MFAFESIESLPHCVHIFLCIVLFTDHLDFWIISFNIDDNQIILTYFESFTSFDQNNLFDEKGVHKIEVER